MSKQMAKEFEGELWVRASDYMRAVELTRQAAAAAAFSECTYMAHLEGVVPNVHVVVIRHSPGQNPVQVAKLSIDTSPSAPPINAMLCPKCGVNRLRENCPKPFECAMQARAGWRL